MKLTSAALGLGLAALCACSPAAPAADGAKAETAAAPAPAAPVELDGPVAGKWKVTKTVLGQALPAEEVCYDRQTPLADTQKVQDQQNVTCSEQTSGREGDAFVVRHVCTMEVMDTTYTITTDMRAVGDFRSRYALDTSVRTNPELLKGMGEQKLQISAERLGDCDPK